MQKIPYEGKMIPKICRHDTNIWGPKRALKSRLGHIRVLAFYLWKHKKDNTADNLLMLRYHNDANMIRPNCALKSRLGHIQLLTLYRWKRKDSDTEGTRYISKINKNPTEDVST